MTPVNGGGGGVWGGEGKGDGSGGELREEIARGG